jgi:hypothetical protein
MIVKLSGGIDRVLMLAPVLRECKFRNPDEKIFLETDYPLYACEEVDEAAVFIDRSNESVLVLDIFNEVEEDMHIMDLYASILLGDTRIGNRMIDNIPYLNNTGEGEAAIAVDSKVSEIVQDLSPYGKTKVVGLDDIVQIRNASIFIGFDSDVSYIAMATRTPMIMIFDKRSYKYIRPFRKDVPFEAIETPHDVCPSAPFCLKKNGFMEFKNVYGVNCDNDNRFSCESYVTKDMIVDAVIRILNG